MARSPQRYLAFVAMLVVAGGAGLMVFIGWLLVGGFEGHEATGEDWHFLAAAVAGLASTLAVLAGLTVGSRALTAFGVVPQAGVAAWLVLILQMTDWADDDTREVVLALLGFGVAALLTVSAVFMPPQAGQVPERLPAQTAEGAESTPARNLALIAMSVVALVSLALLISFVQLGDLVNGVTGGVGLAGAGVCLFALWARLRSLAAGVAVAQAVLVLLLFLLFGHAVGRYGVVHLLIGAADLLAMWAALGPGLRTPRSAAPRPRAQG